MAGRPVAAVGVDVHSEDEDVDVFDVDALIAESDRKPFRFRFGGETYTLPPSPDIRAVAALSEDQNPQAMTTAMVLLLGKEQWQRLLESDAVLDAHTMKAIMDRYAEHGGLTLPNSSGSSEPSARTVPPSKRTSNGSTGRSSRASQTGR